MNALPLSQQSLSLDHDALLKILVETDNLLIIQDLDGVCMDLVNDPLTRTIEPDYVRATQYFDGNFFVLTNGEHIGRRGVNRIIEKAFGGSDRPKTEQLYLPGLAAGGVQWQTRQGESSHPGVSNAELNFLAEVPGKIENCLQQFFQEHAGILTPEEQKQAIAASVLDNAVSPTANLNFMAESLQEHPQVYRELQATMADLMQRLLREATEQGLDNAFFFHYAPNLGRDTDGVEMLRPASKADSGTTDFQFMLRGGLKEAGVLALLNRYYHQRYGTYPLGETFNAREAPHGHQELLALVKANFDLELLPLMIGVGDTVTSLVEESNGQRQVRRGGSDRNFLHLIQEIGQACDRPNLVVYVDSSQGELKNRKSLPLDTQNGKTVVTEGPGDPKDTEDPLTLNVVFPGGFRQYTALFHQAAHDRCSNSSN